MGLPIPRVDRPLFIHLRFQIILLTFFFYSPLPSHEPVARSNDYLSKITFYFHDQVVGNDSEHFEVYDPAILAVYSSIKP